MSVAEALRARATEKEFQAAVVELARALGYRTYHTYSSRRSTPGFPDLVIVRPGSPPIFAELKAERGALSTEQAWWVDALGAEVWRPSDWDRICRVLKGRG